jgi:hypothetical protein
MPRGPVSADIRVNTVTQGTVCGVASNLYSESHTIWVFGESVTQPSQTKELSAVNGGRPGAPKVDVVTLTGLACVGDCVNVVTWDCACMW